MTDRDMQSQPDDAGETPLSDAPTTRIATVKFFGQYLLSRNLITPEALTDALRYQESVNIPIGALALSKGLLSEKQVLHIHTEQRRADSKFGEIAVRKGFLSRPQLDLLLREQKESRVFLGEALRQQGHLTREGLASALKSYQEEQQSAEMQVQKDLLNLEEQLLINTSIRLSGRMLLRMGGIVSKVAAVDVETRLGGNDYLVWQEVTGDKPFTYAMSVGTSELMQLARAMLISVGEPDDELPSEVDLLVIDVGKEFVNVVVGHVCTRLSHEGYKTMPLPPDAEEGDIDLPTPWDGPSKRVNVRLVLTRGELALSILTPAKDD